MARSSAGGAATPIAGCAVQILGLGALALLADWTASPGRSVLALALAIFGNGQGLVMAPWSSMVLATVGRADAGSAAGIYATTVQVANAAGVARIGRCSLPSRKPDRIVPPFSRRWRPWAPWLD